MAKKFKKGKSKKFVTLDELREAYRAREAEVEAEEALKAETSKKENNKGSEKKTEPIIVDFKDMVVDKNNSDIISYGTSLSVDDILAMKDIEKPEACYSDGFAKVSGFLRGFWL